MKKIIINILIVAVIIAAIAFTLSGNKEEMKMSIELAQETNDFIAVKVQPIDSQLISSDFSANGYFQPFRELTLSSETSGRITQILVKDGQWVKKGQLLARIDDQLIKDEVEVAEANFEKIGRDKVRIENLQKVGGATQAQLDDISIAYVNSKSRLVNATKRFTDTFIKAPFAGINDKRHIEIGKYLKTAEKLFDLVDVSRLKMMVNVTESQVLRVTAGMDASVSSQVFRGEVLNGEVTRTGAKAGEALTFPVEILVENDMANSLKAGMYGTARFRYQENHVLAVPRRAIVGSLDNALVYLYKDSIAVQRTIVLGKSNDQFAEIIEGLEKNDRVITSGQINLFDGAKVGILN